MQTLSRSHERLLAWVLLACSLGLGLILLQLVGQQRSAAAGIAAVPEVPFVSSRPLPGFAFDKVMCAAWSRDRTHWSAVAPLLRGCDTPQLAWVGDRLFAYYACRAGFARTELVADSAGGVEVGASDLLPIAGHQMRGDTDPSVLRLPSGGYRLFYAFSMGGVDPAKVPTEVHTATSPDGLHWKDEPGYRARGVGLVDPEAVVAPDGRTRLFYTLGSDRRVHSAISSDGLDFEDEAGVRVDGGVSSTIRLPDGKYMMVFQGPGGFGAGRRLGAALSSDALSFQPDSGFTPPGTANLAGDMESPSLTLMPDGTWLMIFMTPAGRR